MGILSYAGGDIPGFSHGLRGGLGLWRAQARGYFYPYHSIRYESTHASTLRVRLLRRPSVRVGRTSLCAAPDVGLRDGLLPESTYRICTPSSARDSFTLRLRWSPRFRAALRFVISYLLHPLGLGRVESVSVLVQLLWGSLLGPCLVAIPWTPWMFIPAGMGRHLGINI